MGLRLAIGDYGISIYMKRMVVPTQRSPILIIVADTGAWSQLEALEALATRKKRSIVIGLRSSHSNGNDVAGDRVVDVTAAACTQVVMALYSKKWVLALAVVQEF